MKPLLIVPPAPARLPAIESLLAHAGEARLADLRARLTAPPTGSHDAFAVVPDGANVLAIAAIRRFGPIGVLGDLFIRPDVRRAGHAARLLQTLLSWFDMTAGRWLYLLSPTDVAVIFENFGFVRGPSARLGETDQVMMLRALSGVAANPYLDLSGQIETIELSRAHWPLMVAMQQVVGGPDPRVSGADASVAAEVVALDLVRESDAGKCAMIGLLQGGCLTAMGSFAIDQMGARTYALRMPASGAAGDAIHAAVLQSAAARGYTHVDFPMEIAAGAVG